MDAIIFHASMFKYFELSEFSKKEQKRKRKMLEDLERHLEFYLQEGFD